MASIIPAVAKMMKMTVREISTASVICIGLPSYGVPPTSSKQVNLPPLSTYNNNNSLTAPQLSIECQV